MSLLRAPAGEQRSAADIPGPLDALYGGSARTALPMRISTTRAMRHGAVWASVDFISELICTLPVDTYTRGSDGIARQIANPQIIENPGTDVDPISWRRQVVASWLLRGNTFPIVASRDSMLRPRMLDIIDADRVQGRRAGLNTGAITWLVDGKETNDLLHWPAKVMPGSPIGLAPLEHAAQAVGLGLSAEEFGYRWFVDGGHPTALLTTEQRIDAKTARTIVTRFLAALRGTRKPVVLGHGLTYQPLSVAANESQFLETIQANVGDIARFFGLKPPDIGGASNDSMTYANVEQRSIDRLIYPIAPWVIRFEWFLSQLLPRPQFVKFNLGALVRADMATRYLAHDLAIRMGKNNPDEIRALEDEPPIPDGKGQVFLWPPYATNLPPAGAPKPNG